MTATEAFRVTVEAGAESARVVAAGEIDLVSAPSLRAALDEAADRCPGLVVIDLSEVTFLDSSGLNCLLGARAALVRVGRAVVVDGASPRVERVFAVAGVLPLFQRPVPG